MIKFREHRGGLDTSMKTYREFANMNELHEHLCNLVGSIVADKAVFSRYPAHGDNTDPRIGWENVHIVTSPGYGVIGFLDEPKGWS